MIYLSKVIFQKKSSVYKKIQSKILVFIFLRARRIMRIKSKNLETKELLSLKFLLVFKIVF